MLVIFPFSVYAEEPAPAPVPAPVPATNSPTVTEAPSPTTPPSTGESTPPPNPEIVNNPTYKDTDGDGVNDTKKTEEELFIEMNNIPQTSDEVYQEILDLQEDGDFAQRYAINNVMALYEDNATEYACGIFDTIDSANILGEDDEDSSNNKFYVLYECIKVIGYALVSFYFIIDLLDKASTITITKEQFFGILVKMVIAKSFIDAGWSLMLHFYKFGLAFVDGIAATSNMYEHDYTPIATLVAQIRDDNIISNVLTGFQYQLCGFIPMICMFIVSLVVWSIMIEMIVKAMFAPIAFAEMMHSGLHGSGFHYVKVLFASCLQFGAIVLALYVANALQVSILSNDIGSPLYNINIINLVTVFIITKAASWVNGIIR